MVCQGCQKATATVHLTDIKPSGEPIERHLCEGCAAREGVAVKQHTLTATVLQEFIKQGLGLKSLGEKVCPQCGGSFKEFHEQGLLGCPYDYTAYRDLLKPIIERAQDGAARHVGKSPRPAGEGSRRRARLAQLHKALREAVGGEEYERAAKIRDEISAMEKE